MVPALRVRRHTRYSCEWRAAAALAVVLLLLSACGRARAASPDRGDELLSPLPARSTECVAEGYPQELPSVDTVVDSAVLAAAVHELRRQDPVPAGYVLLTLAFDQEGTNIRRDVIEHNTAPLVADSIQRLVFAARREVEDSDRQWGVRLRVDLAEPIGLRLGRREFCPPVARNPRMREAMLGYNPPGVRIRAGARERVIHMRALVDASGLITTAHVEQGDLRGSSLERDIAEYLRQFLFIPATLDGIPTGAWVAIPVRIRA